MTKQKIIDRVYQAYCDSVVADRSNDYGYGRQLVKDMFRDFLWSHSCNNTKQDLIVSLKYRYQHLMKINISDQMHQGIVDELKRYDFINSL